ncbi:DAK2 domain-containing protein [Mesorhizobium sp. M1A.F.Ca.IN.020.30.1.1]|uniref:dihydroxyacetone kinase subunit DhaK n=12 Tax=Mesorhizobium TaxID=68287 RepID=UPI000BAF5567|nr:MULTISPECIES: dihydroxyacetone kinase subunit DhaK [unclassified Mesorhizobium]TGV94886.1 DAK2 domain-containing protein [Mesorhizobium sp. M00.F.Ca.ET.158.01.1.1]AZO60025.1 DAK2 domain-containing protein [Mesorhizobium sp. M1A.F.Ca.IN.022.06.1.1]MCT2576475.1 dihydroxyacetone kinase subunit DhaK [Mesorhizobium sp. P13.3]MDF3164593.1 dihydroxyacetone kinase subunit DhaK [Mesorhizobium sp. P16.1]MDF3180200.1 dihydroxyacetone kinase subunit DhaK [Mesorhizobium sp. P17.1]
MKHFFNRKDSIVTEALDGYLATAGSGALARLDGYPEIKVVLRADWDKAKVSVVSGGGAGHEPSHAGFVGAGMLTAAVSGEIFASPSVEAVLAAIRATTGPAGCLLIVKNYTGDRLNFGLAAEKARAEGFAVDMVIVGDDIALPDIAQPRGIAGTLFVHKIAGHLSESGHDLASVAAAAQAAAKDIVSLGISLSSCSIPGQTHEDRFGAGDGELGLGIHGEPGVERITLQSASALVAIMADRLAARLDAGSRYALLINNLGSVPPLEMSLIANAVLASPLAKAVRLTIGPGHLMTALNMNGFSLSLIRLEAEREAALLAPVGPHAWLPARPVRPPVVVTIAQPAGRDIAKAASRDAGAERLIAAVCEKLISLEEALNDLDAKAGDGDTGSTVATGARSVLDRVDTLPLAHQAATLATIGDTLGTSMGGSSGVLLSIFFTAAAQSLNGGAPLSKALLAGLDRMTFYGGAKLGDRTMVDALEPALKALDTNGLEAAASAARRGAQATAAMPKAKAGRSAYIGRQLDIADPGAFAVAEAFAAMVAMFVPA